MYGGVAQPIKMGASHPYSDTKAAMRKGVNPHNLFDVLRYYYQYKPLEIDDWKKVYQGVDFTSDALYPKK